MRGSIAYQAQIVFNVLNGINSSKRTRREQSEYKGEKGQKVSDKVHSFPSKDQFIRLTKDILKHQEELGLRPNLHTLTKDVLHSYVNDKIEKGLVYESISTYLSVIKKLRIGITLLPNNRQEEYKQEVIFSSKDVKEVRRIAKEQALGSKHVNRAYTNPEAIGIHMIGNASLSFQLQKDYGLRVTAATKISPDQLKAGNRFEFVNKGGKPQTIKINPLLHQQLRIATSQGKGLHIHYNRYLSEFKKAVELSGQKYYGTHGLRYSYAQARVQELRKQGLSDIEAKRIVSNDLGHKRLDITDHYLFAA